VDVVLNYGLRSNAIGHSFGERNIYIIHPPNHHYSKINYLSLAIFLFGLGWTGPSEFSDHVSNYAIPSEILLRSNFSSEDVVSIGSPSSLPLASFRPLSKFEH
jgi:hypothetical protein